MNTRKQRLAKGLRVKWGRWELSKTLPTSLDIDNGNELYDVVLSSCKSIKQRINWLLHLACKNWISERDLQLLALAFSEIYRDKLPEPKIIHISSVPVLALLEIAKKKWGGIGKFIELNKGGI